MYRLSSGLVVVSTVAVSGAYTNFAVGDTYLINTTDPVIIRDFTFSPHASGLDLNVFLEESVQNGVRLFSDTTGNLHAGIDVYTLALASDGLFNFINPVANAVSAMMLNREILCSKGAQLDVYNGSAGVIVGDYSIAYDIIDLP